MCPETTFLRSTNIIWEVVLDDALSHSQKVLGLKNVALKMQEVTVAIKSVCSSNDTFVCFPTCYTNFIYYQIIQLCEMCK